MKKILSLFALVLMSCMGAWAQGTVDYTTFSTSPAPADGAFANGTKFYTIKCGRAGYLASDRTNGSVGVLTLTNSTKPTNDAGKWAMVQTENGIQFYNKATGTTKVLTASSGVSNTSYTFMGEDLNATNSYWDCQTSLNPSFESGYETFMIHGSADYYWNEMASSTSPTNVSHLAIWNSAQALWGWGNSESNPGNGDGGSKFKIEFAEELAINTYTFVLADGITVSYDGSNYVNGQTVDVMGALPAAELAVVTEAPEGHKYKAVVDNEAKTVKVVDMLLPQDGKTYVLQNADDPSLYVVLAVASDFQGDASNASQGSLTTLAGATPFTFTANGTGFTLSTEDEGTTKYLGINGAKKWNVKTDVNTTVWYFTETEQGTYFTYSNVNSTSGLGVDGLASGKGIYTNKSVSEHNNWNLVEYVAPAETHNVYVYLDGAAEGTKMLPGEDGEYVATLIDLEAGAHEVSVVYDEETPVEGTFSSTEKNNKITVHYKDGAITFENDVVTVTIGESGYATLYSDRDLNFNYSGATVYVLVPHETEANMLHAEQVLNAQAETGVVVKGTPGQTYEFNHISQQPGNKGVLTGVLVDTSATGNELVLGYKDEVVGFYKYTGTTLAAGKAYYVPASASVGRVLVDFDGTLTAIDLNTITPVANAIFDLQGRRVVKAQNGLFIQNGKKVIR